MNSDPRPSALPKNFGSAGIAATARSSGVVSVIAIALLLSACASSPKKKEVAASSDELTDIIDVHVHPRFTGQPERTSKIPVTREEFVREMKEAHVTGAVALEGEDGKGYDTDLASMNTIRCAGISKTVDVARIEKGLKSGFYRCLKVYLGYVHQYAYDKHYEPAYKLAEKIRCPGRLSYGRYLQYGGQT